MRRVTKEKKNRGSTHSFVPRSQPAASNHTCIICRVQHVGLCGRAVAIGPLILELKRAEVQISHVSTGRILAQHRERASTTASATSAAAAGVCHIVLLALLDLMCVCLYSLSRRDAAVVLGLNLSRMRLRL